ncbi:heat-inducible transcriptional repressor HrcA [Acidihalobacter ferrooxydans]|uniref:Heat-inducible transcription repressor HrcA n=1 Tax=Acidihalobacter ferrooxydans TaxID=1765967 RepID=A0A1P8UEF3_9GAMM|nr:heat-inducible transcriptional repressor HrcA [Acidihalobacter ferrooxydans]APZ42232.1 heat-inducible transcription repressor HrcA [Acidihalobacter ferrooxydans]
MAHKKRNPSNDNALNDRSLRILKVLVEEYISCGQPVGSSVLSRTSGLQLSSATVRNIVADLENMGFVRSPHTSAGRVPTAQGYRLFVDTLLQQRPPVAADLKRLRVHLDPDLGAGGLVESASDVLSGITRLAGVVTLPRGSQAALRQVEFLPLSGQRVLAILVMNQRDVQNRIIQLDREYTQSELEQIANYLNEHYAGRDLRTIRHELLRDLEAMRIDMDRLMRSAIELGGKALADDEQSESGYVMAGQGNLLDYEELADLDRLRALFSAFAERSKILHLLDKSAHAEDVQIFIGHESGYDIFDYLSVVAAPYAVNGEVIGVLGVIGPTRMPYDRVIPVVDVTARMLGEALDARA